MNYFKNTDPRYYQLLIQLFLLAWGFFYLDFSNSFFTFLGALATSLSTQIIFTYLLKLPVNPLSAVNSTLSILILLQTNHWFWITLACLIAISSKFLLRYHKTHIFNPSNIGIVTVLLITDSAWVASGQWGQALWFILLISGLGLVLFIGFARMLTSISFLIVFSLILFSRALWLGDPLTIPLHQLQNGAVLIFTFFMLSDPKTTPNNILGRLIFGSVVAVLSWFLLYHYYIANAFLYALAFLMPLVYFLNYYFQGSSYQWPLLRKSSL